MSIIYFAIPVAPADVARAGRTFALWQSRGYRTAAVLDNGAPYPPEHCDMTLWAHEYRGWARAVNLLAGSLVYDWLVTGGADVLPDERYTAQQIAAECGARFGGTLGVMQPAGDSFGAIAAPAVDGMRACVSPWIGREWIRKTYGGRGPMHDGYRHCYADGELWSVARRAGRLWWRGDLSQYHDHWTRRGDAQPAHLAAQAEAHGQADKALYFARLAAGFEGSEVT